MSTRKIYQPRPTSFNCPQGIYPARLIDIFPHKAGQHTGHRFMFEVLLQRNDGLQYVAARNYSNKPIADPDFLSHMTTWLGKDCFAPHGYLETEALIGKMAWLELQHIRNQDYREPFVKIMNIRPWPWQPNVETGTSNPGFNPDDDSLHDCKPPLYPKLGQTVKPEPRWESMRPFGEDRKEFVRRQADLARQRLLSTKGGSLKHEALGETASTFKEP